jgi:Peptidase family M13
MDDHTWRPDQACESSTTALGTTYSFIAAVSAGSIMSDTIRALLHNILDGKYSNNRTNMATAERNFDLENFQMMKDLYETCMNEDAIKAYGVKPVRDLLDEFDKVFPREGKPVIGGSNEELTKTVIWLGKHSVEGIVSSDTTVSSLL